MTNAKSLVKRGGDTVQNTEQAGGTALLKDAGVAREGLKVAGKVVDALKAYGEYQTAKVKGKATIDEWERRLAVARVDLEKTLDTHAVAREAGKDRRNSLEPLQQLLREMVVQATSVELPPEKAKDVRAYVLELGQILVDLHGK